MRLTATSEGSLFHKFRAVGDRTEGTFVSFQMGVPSKFGPEDHLRLMRADGSPVIVRCSAQLSAIFRQNAQAVPPGTRVRVTFIGTVPNGTPNPTKQYTVDVPGAGATVQAQPAARPVAQPPRTYGQQPHNPRQGPPPAQQAPAQADFGDVGDGAEDDVPF